VFQRRLRSEIRCLLILLERRRPSCSSASPSSISSCAEVVGDSSGEDCGTGFAPSRSLDVVISDLGRKCARQAGYDGAS